MFNRTSSMNDKDSSFEMTKYPYREGQAPPEETHVLSRLHDDKGRDLGLFWLDRSRLDGRIRHELGEQARKVRWIWRHLRQHVSWCRTLEAWEFVFRCDENPAEEIGLWMRITFAYLKFTCEHPKADKEAVFHSLLALANGQGERIQPKAVAAKLEQLLAELPSSLADDRNYSENGVYSAGERWLR